MQAAAGHRDCRVDKPNQCTKLSLNKWGRGFHTDYKYKDIRYHHNGLQIYRPEDGLTIYQRREFLTPEFYDQGCWEYHCPRKSLCPAGTLSGPTPQEKIMYDRMFQSRDPYELNGGPPQCAGIKNGNENSYLGWMVPPGQSKFLWMLNGEEARAGDRCLPA